MNNEYWKTKMNHPAVRGMFRSMERQMEDVDFDLHVREAINMANSDTHDARCVDCNHLFDGGTVYECPACASVNTAWERKA